MRLTFEKFYQCASAERHLNVAAPLFARLLLQEPEKYAYMLTNPAALPPKTDFSKVAQDSSVCVEEFLRDVYVRSGRHSQKSAYEVKQLEYTTVALTLEIFTTHKHTCIH